jgi:hypothetical protein
MWEDDTTRERTALLVAVVCVVLIVAGLGLPKLHDAFVHLTTTTFAR